MLTGNLRVRLRLRFGGRAWGPELRLRSDYRSVGSTHRYELINQYGRRGWFVP
jgi:hypothetical protein